MHPDLEKLISEKQSFMQQALTKDGKFYPFGCEMTIEGEVVNHHAFTLDDHPVDKNIDTLTRAFRQKAAAGQLRGACIYWLVHLTSPEETDAIRMGLEHQNGEAVDFYVPYKKGLFGKITYGEPFWVTRKREFFV